MNLRKSIIIGTLGLAGIVGLSSSMYTIDETEQAVITRYQEAKKVIVGSQEHGQPNDSLVNILQAKYDAEGKDIQVTSGAGLYFKTPFIETVHKFEDRILEYDAEPADALTKDKKHLKVDNYARWRINDPLKFLKTAVTENAAIAKLNDVIYSRVKSNLGENNLIEIVRSTNSLESTSEKDEFEKIEVGREEIMDQITYASREESKIYGIGIIDVRIKGTDLPQSNRESVYTRMKAERNRIATKYRSEGKEEAQNIRSETDKLYKQIVSEGTRQADSIRGVGDGQAAAIYNNAYRKDPGFYKFQKSLESYKKTVPGSKLVLSTNGEYAKYLTKTSGN